LLPFIIADTEGTTEPLNCFELLPFNIALEKVVVTLVTVYDVGFDTGNAEEL
jgi:hypothetical protein